MMVNKINIDNEKVKSYTRNISRAGRFLNVGKSMPIDRLKLRVGKDVLCWPKVWPIGDFLFGRGGPNETHVCTEKTKVKIVKQLRTSKVKGDHNGPN